MKLEELAQKRALQQEVKNLAAQLQEEEQLKQALTTALNARLHLPHIPKVRPHARKLLLEVATAEDEIDKLETKLNELKLKLWEVQREQHLRPHARLDRSLLSREYRNLSKSMRCDFTSEKIEKARTSVGSAGDTFPTTPNEISEKLLKCLIAIFSDFSGNEKSSDPYGIIERGNIVRDAGAYKEYVQIGNIGRRSSGLFWMSRMRVLMHRLRHVDVTKMGYKEKLAFWINIYNGCVMRAFLKYGVPTSESKITEIENKAEVNVGGMMFHSSTIERIILKHPTKVPEKVNERMLLRQTYGLGYPEPNVQFALCRGNWSSPALRIYTAEGVTNELGKAKAEYLEASVGVTRKRIIIVPQLLEWHKREFADDMESLIKWVYSQLPKSGSLKKAMVQCFNGETKTPTHKLVQIQPYESKFRYLLTHV